MAVAGSPSTPQASKPALQAQQPEARAAQSSPGSSSLSGQQPPSSQEPSTSQQQTADDTLQQDAPSEGTASPAEVEQEAESSNAGGQEVSAAELKSREAASDGSKAAAGETPAPAPRATGLTREGYAEEGSDRLPFDRKEGSGRQPHDRKEGSERQPLDRKEGSERQPFGSKEQQGVTDEDEDATNRMLQSAGRGKLHLLAQITILIRRWSCVSC